MTEPTWLRAHPNIELISFSDGEEEVARAEVHTRTRLYDNYVGLSAPPLLDEVVFLEVRADRYRQGLGTMAVRMLEQRFAGERLFAFSECVDDFWAGAGWAHFPRADGDRTFRPLFVSPRPGDWIAG